MTVMEVSGTFVHICKEKAYFETEETFLMVSRLYAVRESAGCNTNEDNDF